MTKVRKRTKELTELAQLTTQLKAANKSAEKALSAGLAAAKITRHRPIKFTGALKHDKT